MKRMGWVLRNAFAVIAVIYLLLLALLLLAQFVLPAEYGDLTRTLFSIGLLLSWLLLPVCLLLRHWRTAGSLVVPMVLCGMLYGPLLLPRPAAVSVQGPSIRILTFNLQAATADLESLTRILQEAEADLVAVQELSYAAADHFRQRLNYPHMALHPQENAHLGQGVFSRYPITTENYWRNDQLEATLGHLRVEVTVEDTTIVLYSTHPVPPISFDRGLNLQPHREEIEELLQRANSETHPVILVGDFNMTDQFNEYPRITADYTDTYAQVGSGLGFTFPNGQRLPFPPLIRLDYIFHDDSFVGSEAYVWHRSGSSDHLPLFARLVLVE